MEIVSHRGALNLEIAFVMYQFINSPWKHLKRRCKRGRVLSNPLAATQFILDAMQTDCHTSLRNSFFWTFHPFPRQFSISNANLTMTKTKTITLLPWYSRLLNFKSLNLWIWNQNFNLWNFLHTVHQFLLCMYFINLWELIENPQM